MEKEMIKKDAFMFFCPEMSMETFKELGEEVLIINPMKEDVIEAYRLIRQYLIPFATILDKNDEVTFIIINSGDKDISEIIEFANKILRDKIKWNISKRLLSEYFQNIKGYRVALSTCQAEKLTLHGEILKTRQRDASPSVVFILQNLP